MTRIIEPPVSIYSASDEIQEWIDFLETMPDSEEVREAIADARRMLEIANHEGR